MRKFLIIAATAMALSGGVAQAASAGPDLPTRTWPWQGMFGTFDQAQLRRGFQVYREVCSSCHSLNLIAFRNLTALGYTEDDVKTIAAQFEVLAGPNEDGETHDEDGIALKRPGTAPDYFPAPFPNANAARAANGGALPPDLSLIVKARKGGPDYLFALLTRGYADLIPERTLQEVFAAANHAQEAAYEAALETYEEKVAKGQDVEKPAEPEPIETIEGLGLPEDKYFNAYFPGHAIGMAPPLFDEAVEYEDGTPMTLDQHAKDVVAFLTWSASPEMEVRKRTGLAVLIFLVVFSAMLLALKRQIWSATH